MDRVCTHLTRHSLVCFAGCLTWLRCSRDPQVIFLAGYSKQTRKCCFKQVTINKGQISTVKKMTKLPFRALETQTLSSYYCENLTNFNSSTHTNFSPSRQARVKLDVDIGLKYIHAHEHRLYYSYHH